MNHYNNFDDDDDFYSMLFSSQNKQKTSSAPNINTNTNNDNLKLNEQHKLFSQNMNQVQMLQKKMEKPISSNNEQHQVKKTTQIQNQKRIQDFFAPCTQNNMAKQPPQLPLFINSKSLNRENPLQNKNHQIKIQEIQENFQQKKSHTLEICTVCLQPKEIDHQCNDEYGLISCPYCSEHIVRNFLKDHLIECIPYIEHQFQNLDKVEECSICMENLVKDQWTLKCAHQFHKQCIDGWKLKSKECPVCRKPI